MTSNKLRLPGYWRVKKFIIVKCLTAVRQFKRKMLFEFRCSFVFLLYRNEFIFRNETEMNFSPPRRIILHLSASACQPLAGLSLELPVRRNL